MPCRLWLIFRLNSRWNQKEQLVCHILQPHLKGQVVIHDILRLNYLRLITNILFPCFFFSQQRFARFCIPRGTGYWNVFIGGWCCWIFFSSFPIVSWKNSTRWGCCNNSMFISTISSQFFGKSLQIFPIKNRIDLHPRADSIWQKITDFFSATDSDDQSFQAILRRQISAAKTQTGVYHW